MSIGAGWGMGDGSGTEQSRTVVRLETSRPYDLALLQLAPPFIRTTPAPGRCGVFIAGGGSART